MPLLLILLLNVTLSPPFGDASARLIGFTSERVTIELSVETLEPTALVLVRGVDVSKQELDPIAMSQREEDGTWGAVVELPARRDLRLAFELIPPSGPSVLSAASSLAELGIDPDRLTLVDPPPSPEPDGGSGPPVGLPWIIVACVAGLLALVLLMLWSRQVPEDPNEA